jgi:hypothetical protein
MKMTLSVRTQNDLMSERWAVQLMNNMLHGCMHILQSIVTGRYLQKQNNTLLDICSASFSNAS